MCKKITHEIIVMVLLTLSVSGCANAALSLLESFASGGNGDLNEVWGGLPEEKLLEVWSSPDKTKTINDKKYHTWLRKYGRGNQICEKTFVIDEAGVIESYSSNCPARLVTKNRPAISLSRWVGVPEEDLLKAKSVPDRTVLSKGKKYHTWNITSLWKHKEDYKITFVIDELGVVESVHKE